MLNLIASQVSKLHSGNWEIKSFSHTKLNIWWTHTHHGSLWNVWELNKWGTEVFLKVVLGSWETKNKICPFEIYSFKLNEYRVCQCDVYNNVFRLSGLWKQALFVKTIIY